VLGSSGVGQAGAESVRKVLGSSGIGQAGAESVRKVLGSSGIGQGVHRVVWSPSGDRRGSPQRTGEAVGSCF